MLHSWLGQLSGHPVGVLKDIQIVFKRIRMLYQLLKIRHWFLKLCSTYIDG